MELELLTSKGTERNLEYDTVSARYGQWVQGELLPHVEAETRSQIPNQAVRLTSDPEGRGAIGCSSGAAAAFTMAWFQPDSFRRIISYSGSYTNLQFPTDPIYPRGAWSYPERLIKRFPKKSQFEYGWKWVPKIWTGANSEILWIGRRLTVQWRQRSRVRVIITILILRKMPVTVMAASLLRRFLKRCSGFGRTIPSSKLLGTWLQRLHESTQSAIAGLRIEGASAGRRPLSLLTNRQEDYVSNARHVLHAGRETSLFLSRL